MSAGVNDHYRAVIASLVERGVRFTPTRETATAVQVERATVIVHPSAATSPTPNVIDAAGHRRPVYRPVLACAYRAAGADPGVVGQWIASLQTGDVPFTAAAGAEVAAAVWSALATGQPGVVARLVAHQQPSGAFLLATPSDNPEVHWYHELVILHAAANHAVRAEDATAWDAVERATRFHLNETETDHATGQPWGLPAFVRVPGAGPLADAALHAVAAHQPAGPAGLALFLLADTLYGLAPRSDP